MKTLILQDNNIYLYIENQAMDRKEIEQQFNCCKTEEDIKNTYLRLAKILHPDVGGSNMEFKYLNEIYSSKKKRIITFLTADVVKTKS